MGTLMAISGPPASTRACLACAMSLMAASTARRGPRVNGALCCRPHALRDALRPKVSRLVFEIICAATISAVRPCRCDRHGLRCQRWRQLQSGLAQRQQRNIVSSRSRVPLGRASVGDALRHGLRFFGSCGRSRGRWASSSRPSSSSGDGLREQSDVASAAIGCTGGLLCSGPRWPCALARGRPAASACDSSCGTPSTLEACQRV
jgi:hypothetical protein